MPDKPTVTDDHLKKYEQIMNTAIKSNESTSPATTSQKSSAAGIVPKIKGIGNKMFIFNGHKKIIMDGKNREEEKAVTVNPKEMKSIEKDFDEKNKPSKELKADTKSTEKTQAKENAAQEAKPSKKSVSKPLIITGIGILLAGWALFWAYFLGFLKF